MKRERALLARLISAGRSSLRATPIDKDFRDVLNRLDSEITEAGNFLANTPDEEPNPDGKSILQSWVTTLGLRHQGVLLTAVRGCDTAPKDDASKVFTRCYRGVILNAHCGDAKKAATFIEHAEPDEEKARFRAFVRNADHYPHHFVMHMCHAIQIVGYKHPEDSMRGRWSGYYATFAHRLHLNQENERQLDQRLNADEQTFAARD